MNTNNINLETFFLLVFGVGVFLYGVMLLRQYLRVKHGKNVYEGNVLSSEKVVRYDNNHNLLQHYFKTEVEVKHNGKQKFNLNLNREYKRNEKIKLTMKGRKLVELKNDIHSLSAIVCIILVGILTTLFVYYESAKGLSSAMLPFVGIFFVIGLGLVLTYLEKGKEKLEPVEGEIVEVLEYKSGKERSKFVRVVTTYYPIVKVNDILMCLQVNSNEQKAFKIGDKVNLYYDAANNNYQESKANKLSLVAGIVMMVFSISGLIGSIGI